MSELEQTPKQRRTRARTRRRAIIFTAALTLAGTVGAMVASDAHARPVNPDPGEGTEEILPDIKSSTTTTVAENTELGITIRR